MKKMIFLMMLHLSCFNVFSQNVGIGITTPLAPLHIKNDNEALRLQGNTTYLSFANNAGILKGFLQCFNNDLYLGTPSSNATGNLQFYAANIPAITIKPTADVIVGNDATNSFGKFTVQTLNNSNGISHLGEGGNILATRMGGTSAGIGTFSNTNMRIFSNSNSAIFVAAATANVGIGTDNPINKLSVQTAISQFGITHTDGNISVSTFVGGSTNGGWIGTQSNHPFSFFTNNSGALMTIATNGSVGIGSSTPSNRLQIGSVGNAAFAGNDLAIGNGTAAMAIYQSNSSTLIGSTTDIILKPRNNGNGRIGINTNTPRAPLDVVNFNDVTSVTGYYYAYINGASGVNGGTVGTSESNPVPQVSIIASGRVYANEFNAYSDARIKDITESSKTSTDLATINALQITDYTMKDKVRYGNQHYKKVIAQEVEKVYPQVVSKHTDFIPNVYQVTNTATKTNNGYLLSFKGEHHIHTNAKRLQLMMDGDEGVQQYEIVSIPSPKDVIIKADEIKANKIFVYGEEVNDFRTVDYEGLTTLNISATQELSKLLIKQQAIITNQQKQLQYLERRLSALEAKPSSRLNDIKYK